MLPIVSQRIGTAGVIGRAQLDENIQLRAVARSFSPGDVDGIWVEIDRVDLAARIDSSNFENVAAVEPEPTAIQRLKTAALSSEESDGSNNTYDHHQDRNSNAKPASRTRLGRTRMRRPLLLLGLAHAPEWK